MFSLVQLFTFGLAALTARNGFQVSTTSNVGVSRVAGQALMAFAVPALAMPLEHVQLVARNETSAPGGKDCDENDDEDDCSQSDNDDEADEADGDDDDSQSGDDDEADQDSEEDDDSQSEDDEEA